MECKKCGQEMKKVKRAIIRELPKSDGSKEEQISGPEVRAGYDYKVQVLSKV